MGPVWRAGKYRITLLEAFIIWGYFAAYTTVFSLRGSFMFILMVLLLGDVQGGVLFFANLIQSQVYFILLIYTV